MRVLDCSLPYFEPFVVEFRDIELLYINNLRQLSVKLAPVFDSHRLTEKKFLCKIKLLA